MTRKAKIFDPVLAELAYSWFCPPSGLVLDPFAGGAVRGIVAAYLGRHYVGFDLSTERIEANRQQAADILGEQSDCRWIAGDARDLDGLYFASHSPADFIFSSPPSALAIADPGAYRDIIALACKHLANHRFACFVVDDLLTETIGAFLSAGLVFHTQAILVTSSGTRSTRAVQKFERSRFLGVIHRYVLVFVKGDPVAAAKAIGKVEFGRDIDPGAADDDDLAGSETERGEL